MPKAGSAPAYSEHDASPMRTRRAIAPTPVAPPRPSAEPVLRYQLKPGQANRYQVAGQARMGGQQEVWSYQGDVSWRVRDFGPGGEAILDGDFAQVMVQAAVEMGTTPSWPPVVLRLSADGALLEIDTGPGATSVDPLALALFLPFQAVFSAAPVKPGDTWERDLKGVPAGGWQLDRHMRCQYVEREASGRGARLQIDAADRERTRTASPPAAPALGAARSQH